MTTFPKGWPRLCLLILAIILSSVKPKPLGFLRADAKRLVVLDSQTQRSRLECLASCLAHPHCLSALYEPGAQICKTIEPRSIYEAAVAKAFDVYIDDSCGNTKSQN